ncbi:MAG: hypothetical protein QOJ97_2214 [Solirubrobacteraceae bacterium]|jgi:uncharacterized membrane protein|nr:hypothetical protein [Solirubrobacteraceae bacterium]
MEAVREKSGGRDLAERIEELDARMGRLEAHARDEHRYLALLAERINRVARAESLPRPTPLPRPAPLARPKSLARPARPPRPTIPLREPAPPISPSLPPAAPARPEPASPSRSPRPGLEDLLGGRLLGLAGGVALVLGIAFLVAVAIGRGWIDEPARILLALTASLGLTLGGALLYERRGRTQAALASVGAGVASLFLTLTAATRLYDLVPVWVALAGALAAGGAATTLAVRWNARTIGALGILGALLSPVLVGAGSSDATVSFLAVALAAAVGALLWRRWEWLSVAALAVVAPQLVVWAYERPSTAALLIFPVAFWALFVTAALGYELRVRAPRPRPSSVGLILVAGALVAGIAWGGLNAAGHEGLADGFLGALGLAHLGLGVAALRSRRVARAFGLVLLAGGVALADTAFGLAVEGPVQVAGWAAGAAAMAALGRFSREDAELLRLGLGAQLALAAVHAVAIDATPAALLRGDGDVSAAVSSLALVAVAAFACARLADGPVRLRMAFDSVSMAAVAYLTAFALDGTTLASTWAGLAVALGAVARREHARAGAAPAGDRAAAEARTAGFGSLAFLALAAIYVLASVVPPAAAFEDPRGLGSLLAVGVVGGAAFLRARQEPGSSAALTCDVLAAAAVAFGTAVVLEGPVLAVAWSAQAALLLSFAARLGGAPSVSTVPVEGGWVVDADGRLELPRASALAFAAGVGFAVLAAAHSIALDAPPRALVDGVDDLSGAALALAGLAAACLAAARLGPSAAWRTGAGLAGAATLVYLGSVVVVGVFPPEAATGIGGLQARQEGQVLLSAFWGSVGLGSLVAGLILGRRPARIGGLVLLVLAIAKVFAFDLATLDSIYRVLSLVGLGLLLLAGAFAWQRLRPSAT